MLRYLIPAFLFLLIIFLFSPVADADFTHLDDKVMVSENAAIRDLSPDNIKSYFTSYHAHLYHPLVTLSYAIEYNFAGLNPRVYHITNLVLHVLNTGLVFCLILILLRNYFVALGVAAIFALHPMHVEAVAWVSARKDVLYAFFFLGSLILYILFVELRRRRFLFFSIIFFALALLAKPMAVTLSMLLPLIYYLRMQKIGKHEFLRMFPFLLLSGLFSLVTLFGYYAAKQQASTAGSCFLFRLQNASENLVFYLIKFFAPAHLSAMYPLPRELGNIPQWLFQWSSLILLLFFIASWRFARSNKLMLFGIGFFIITLLPVSQIIYVGVGTPADRYTYLPYIGLSVFVLLILQKILGKSRIFQREYNAWLVLIILICPFAYLSYLRIPVWKNTISLSEDMLREYRLPDQYYSDGGAGTLVDMRSDIALKYFSRSIELEPWQKKSWLHRGVVYLRAARYQEAVDDFSKAIELDREFQLAYYRRGQAYLGMNLKQMAEADFRIERSLTAKNNAN